MKFTLFVGCNIPARVQQYEIAARAVADRLGIELVDKPEYKCCGYPTQNTDSSTSLMMAARNLALAEQQGLDMMVLCKCCFGSLKKAAHQIMENDAQHEEINDFLEEEDLSFSATLQIKHFLSVCYHDIGIKAIKEKVVSPFEKLNIATHYGCHALRPSNVTQFDDPVRPVIFDELVKVTGAKSVDWPLKLDCCGAPLMGINDELSMDLSTKKLTDSKNAGADFLCVACPYCQMQFDQVQEIMTTQGKINGQLSSMVYPQLLGTAMGIPAQSLGIDMNRIDISNIESFIHQENESDSE